MNYPPAVTLAIAALLLHGASIQAQQAPPSAPAPTPPKPSGPVEVNGIAAKVNGRVITKNEVSFMLAPIYAQLASQFPRRGAEFERQFKIARDGIVQEGTRKKGCQHQRQPN
jgi:hypothetical protein